jgi:hypothetical protein
LNKFKELDHILQHTSDPDTRHELITMKSDIIKLTAKLVEGQNNIMELTADVITFIQNLTVETADSVLEVA